MKRAVGHLAVAAVAATGTAVATRQPWLHLGATRSERAAPLPGDEILQHPMVEATRATGIAAPADRVWPWLVQMGYGRAGWYGYDLWDNGGTASSHRIVPDLQHLAVGDVIADATGPFGFEVVRLDPGSDIVLRATIHPITGKRADPVCPPRRAFPRLHLGVRAPRGRGGGESPPGARAPRPLAPGLGRAGRRRLRSRRRGLHPQDSCEASARASKVHPSSGRPRSESPDAPCFTAVGYGLQRVKLTPLQDLVRYQARLFLIDATSTAGIPAGGSVFFSNNPGRGNDARGGTCFGDSGGPVFLDDTATIVAVTSVGLNQSCKGVGGGYRIDTADDRAFIEQLLD